MADDSPGSGARSGRPPASEQGAASGTWDVHPELVYAVYFLAQAFVGVGLWVSIAVSGTVRRGFDLLPSHHPVTDSFFLADLLVGVVGSAASSFALRRRSAWALPVVAFTAGGMAYPTVYLVSYVAFTGVGGGVLAIMVPPSTITAWVAYQLFRASRRGGDEGPAGRWGSGGQPWGS